VFSVFLDAMFSETRLQWSEKNFERADRQWFDEKTISKGRLKIIVIKNKWFVIGDLLN
jgi:hypothetical protein